MSTFFFEGTREERIKQAVLGMEERCKWLQPQKYEADLLAFAKQQLPYLDIHNKQCPTWVWPDHQPPQHLRYVLDAMWHVWWRAKVRWGDIIHALHARYEKQQEPASS